ncbi:MAG TPA: hypothetical protein PKD52_09810 [Clostridiales bacterium]|nr:hypothetical protein [Clostridiales bacterium]
MFAKLLKHEFSAIAKELLPVYLLMIAAAVITNLLLLTHYDTPSAFAAAIFGAITVAAFVITLVTMIRRFRRNLLKDEGYLMFTLPVTAKQLILTKAIAAIVWSGIGLFCGFLSGFLFILNAATFEWGMIGDFFAFVFSHAQAGDWLVVAEILVSMILNFTLFLFTIYLSVSVAQLPIFKANDTVRRRIVPFGCFILFYIIYIGITSLIGELLPFDANTAINQSSDLLLPLFFGIAIELVTVTAVFFLVDYILRRHLNLE